MSVLRIKNQVTGKWEVVPFVNNENGASVNISAGENIKIEYDKKSAIISAIVPDVSDLASKEELEQKQDKGNYALVSDIPTLDGYVKNTNYATQNIGGVVKIWTSLDEDGNLGLNISTEG